MKTLISEKVAHVTGRDAYGHDIKRLREYTPIPQPEVPPLPDVRVLSPAMRLWRQFAELIESRIGRVPGARATVHIDFHALRLARGKGPPDPDRDVVVQTVMEELAEAAREDRPFWERTGLTGLDFDDEPAPPPEGAR